MASFDSLTATASRLKEKLDSNEISSVQIVEAYLDQINKHNLEGMKLHAMITIAPEKALFEQASELDKERITGKSRGALHGIPIVIKDNFCTGTLGMETTCGCFALKDAKTSRNAAVVDALIKAGMIVIGKANLTEWCGCKFEGQKSGWSAVGGQTQSPYVRGGVLADATYMGHSTPGGSSSGSAVAVAAGFSPVAIGSEADGSVIIPAARAALYSIKCTVGSVDTGGVSGISPAFDSLGAMAKLTKDLADILEVIMKGKKYSSSVKNSWEGLSIGFVDPALWLATSYGIEPVESFHQQTFLAIAAAAEKIRSKGGRLEQPVTLISLEDACQDSEYTLEDLMEYDVSNSIESFLAIFEDPQMPPNVKVPEGHFGLEESNMTPELFSNALRTMRDTAIWTIDRTLEGNDIDVILGPTDARIASVAAIAGYPVASVPLGFANLNGRAFGMAMIAGAGQEAKMLEVMSAWEETFPEARSPPPLLVDWK